MKARIGCKGRCPKMTIPAHHDDDDFYISTTLADAQRALDVAMADNRSYINERHENMKTIEALQAQLADKAAVEIGLRHANDDLHVMLGRAEAQLRQVDGASVPRSRYDALNKDWLEEKESARRLKEVLAQLCLEMECSRNSMFVQMAVNVRATLAVKDAGKVSTSIIGKQVPPSQWDKNAGVRGDIS